jgi:hypothetical protein
LERNGFEIRIDLRARGYGQQIVIGMQRNRLAVAYTDHRCRREQRAIGIVRQREVERNLQPVVNTAIVDVHGAAAQEASIQFARDAQDMLFERTGKGCQELYVERGLTTPHARVFRIEVVLQLLSQIGTQH